VFLLAGHQDDEVVGVTDEPVVRQALAAAFLSLLLDSHRRLPLLDEVVIQYGQGDVGQQRGEESGKDGALLRRPPLRTGLEHFYSSGSSRSCWR
jgi:hypothetical protein